MNAYLCLNITLNWFFLIFFGAFLIQVSVESVIQAFKGNIEKAVQLIIASVLKIVDKKWNGEMEELKVRTNFYLQDWFISICKIDLGKTLQFVFL